MKIRVLGVHNLETCSTKHTCFLVDGKVAIDAGSLMTGLSLEERERLETVLLTHQHFDHLRDLPSLGLDTINIMSTIEIYGLVETLESLRSHLLDGLLYPQFTQRPNLDHPKYALKPIRADEPFVVGEMEVRAIIVPHGVAAVGYILRIGCERVGFTGDTGGGLRSFFVDDQRLSLLFVEVTLSNSEEERARVVGHMTPSLLRYELKSLMECGLRIPNIVIVHRDRRHELVIRQELFQVSQELGVEITLAIEGQEFEV